ncbi:MFS transporter [Brevibacterium antiquum]|uniref:MFS transporter n=1 Tax=Brevibacterium antiquum TaxID=234835 RepID=UPI0018DF3EFC|nr:MFS transporter [Brevibacterium antiquum]
MTISQGTVEFSHRRALRAGVASFAGTTIEFYDFYVFATAAALVFGPLFFPESDPIIGVMFSFATYATGFFVRPLGGIIFGHIGDRYGRRRSLIITLLLMGVGTVLVGLLPTHEQIGILAPILLIVLRIAQGLAIGGEWGGAVLMSVENAPEKFKSFYGAFPQLGNPMGALLSSGIFALISAVPDDFMMNGGWRIPFLLSAVLIAVGFWIRAKVEETPVFEQTSAKDVTIELPLLSAIRHGRIAMLVGIGLIPVSTGGYYILTTFATAYGVSSDVSLDETLILNVLTFAAFTDLVVTLLVGWGSDRMGRKRMFALSLVSTAVLVAPMFLLMGRTPDWVLFPLFALVRLTLMGTWAPLSTLMAQMFEPSYRQTSLSLSYGIGNAIWAGLSPVVATGLYAATNSIWSVIALFGFMTVVSLISLYFARQIKDTAIG